MKVPLGLKFKCSDITISSTDSTVGPLAWLVTKCKINLDPCESSTQEVGVMEIRGSWGVGTVPEPWFYVYKPTAISCTVGFNFMVAPFSYLSHVVWIGNVVVGLCDNKVLVTRERLTCKTVECFLVDVMCFVPQSYWQLYFLAFCLLRWLV